MSVGVMKDYKLKLRKLRASNTEWGREKKKCQFVWKWKSKRWCEPCDRHMNFTHAWREKVLCGMCERIM